jgi:hypothetical protein
MHERSELKESLKFKNFKKIIRKTWKIAMGGNSRKYCISDPEAYHNEIKDKGGDDSLSFIQMSIREFEKSKTYSMIFM